MSILLTVGKTSDLTEGTMKEFITDGNSILIAKVSDKYYAVDNKCPHFGAKLSEGTLEGTVVTCPKHKSQFDLADGHILKWTNFPPPIAAIGKIVKHSKPLITYDVKIEDENILVEI